MDENREFSGNVSTSGDGPSNNIKLPPRTRLLSLENDGDNNNNNNASPEDSEAIEEVLRWNDHLNHVETKLFRFEQEIRDKESDLASTLNDCEALLGKLDEIQIPDTVLNCVTNDDDDDDNLLQITNRDEEDSIVMGLEEQENDFLQSDFSRLITNLHLESEDDISNANINTNVNGSSNSNAAASNSVNVSASASVNTRGLSLSTTERLQMELRALKRKPRVYVSTKFNDEENKFLALATSCASSFGSGLGSGSDGPSSSTALNFDANFIREESGGGFLCEFCGDFIPSTLDFAMHQTNCSRITRRVSE